MSRFKKPDGSTHYSQGGEDEIIDQLFPKPFRGRFLDIGAFDGISNSNTRALYDRGWCGVCVEASPHAFEALRKAYPMGSGVDLVCAAIQNKRAGLQEFYFTNDMVSTVNKDHSELWSRQAGVKFTQFWVATADVLDLTLSFGSNFDFISIDIEGESANTALELARVLGLVSFERLRGLCVEHDGKADLIESAFAPMGFERKFFSGENLILGRG